MNTIKHGYEALIHHITTSLTNDNSHVYFSTPMIQNF
jgi:hypothetical protein